MRTYDKKQMSTTDVVNNITGSLATQMMLIKGAQMLGLLPSATAKPSRSRSSVKSGNANEGATANEITAADIRQMNRALGGTTELTGNADTVIANMAYREGAPAKAATAIRDIAGRHLFDDANKRTAQAVAERLLGSGANPAQIRAVVNRVATGDLRTVEDIAAALGQ